jgi:ribosomal protein S6
MADMSHPEALAEGLTQANSTPSGDTRPIYEIGYHLMPTLTEEGVAAAVEALRKTLGDAEIIKDEAPVKIPLAYMIERRGQGKREKYTEAYFGFIKFALAGQATDKENIGALEQYLRATNEILRHLLIETVREDIGITPRRAVFTSDRLEGEILKKPVAEAEKAVEVSEEELDKSIDAIVA